jgi:UDP-N-acetyl-D-glucosamine dehydrogenase
MGKKYISFSDVARQNGLSSGSSFRPVICVQGLGFVGIAMAVAVANARDSAGNYCFDVIGVDLPTKEGIERIASINRGVFPFDTTDEKMKEAFGRCFKDGVLLAVSDPAVFSLASVTLVSINLDLQRGPDNPQVDMTGFKKAIMTLGSQMPVDSLIIVETTVPPGTCEKVVVPEVQTALKKREMPPDSILIAHSYERVMPGDHYLDSIINFWRVYAGNTEVAADRCRDFLSKVINVRDFPLTRLSSMTASETGKILENSYRAVNIAFMEEWGRFAEEVNIDLFEIISAIRKRPTHSNIKQPGFGVGGYCLTKDPLFIRVSTRDLFGIEDLDFPFCEMAVRINNRMPLVSFEYVKRHFNGNLSGRSILLMGISYKQDIGDTRHSPSQVFAEKAIAAGAEIIASDPMLDYWQEMDMKVQRNIPRLDGVDAVVFAVPHHEYLEFDLHQWLEGYSPFIFDANNVIPTKVLLELKEANYPVQAIGRGGSR